MTHIYDTLSLEDVQLGGGTNLLVVIYVYGRVDVCHLFSLVQRLLQ